MVGLKIMSLLLPFGAKFCQSNCELNPMNSTETRPGVIDSQIHVIRGLSVILDADLAALYAVTVKALLQGVRRNRKRFPADFMFQLTNQEVANLRSQIVTSSLARGYGGQRGEPR
jgi:hypothetical protein